MARRLVVAAAVDACEEPVVRRAAALLQTALRACGDDGVAVVPQFVADVAAVAALVPAPDYAVASLLPELASATPVAAVEQRWREALAAWPASFPSLLMCTIFRHVDPALAMVEREALRERIRRLALVAIEISHDTGAHVVDFDRTLAHVGARALASDCRFGSGAAIEVGARTLVRSMLALARDESITAEMATCVEARLGQPWDALAPPRP